MPQHHGGCVYPDAVLRALSETGISIDYAWLAWPLNGPRAGMRDPLQARYIRRGYVPGTCKVGDWRLRAPKEWFWRKKVPAYNSMAYESLPGPTEQAFLRTLTARLKPRAVLVDFTTTLPVLDGLSSATRAGMRVAVLTHNLIHRRAELYRERGITLDFCPLTRDHEADLLRRADVIVAIQEREAEQFRLLVPDRQVIVVPMPITRKTQIPEDICSSRCLFVGGYSGHNLDGIRWFLSEIWPSVLSEQPLAELDVVGTVGEAVPKGTPRTRVHGSQANLTSMYARANLCVVPLRLGTGLKIKLIEAMANGRAVVTTPSGAEGFPELEQGKIAVVSESADAMAVSIVRLLRDQSARSAQVARQNSWLFPRFSPEQAIVPLARSLSIVRK